ncbi:hypothetical protein FM106_16060 [Brachybacterium faecium]|nr:hypothetical protein FM106_16060 [Brachybacterium faecium]
MRRSGGGSAGPVMPPGPLAGVCCSPRPAGGEGAGGAALRRIPPWA